MLPLHLPKKVLDRHPPHHAYMHMIQTEKPGQPLPAFVKTKKVGPFLIQLAGVAESLMSFQGFHKLLGSLCRTLGQDAASLNLEPHHSLVKELIADFRRQYFPQSAGESAAIDARQTHSSFAENFLLVLEDSCRLVTSNPSGRGWLLD